MDEEQMNRFEFFTRSHFDREDIKKILAARLGFKAPSEVSDEIAIVVAGLAKLYVGEIVESGKELSIF
jgi:hypothetical protein